MSKKYIYNSLIVLVCFIVYKYSKYIYAFVFIGQHNWQNLNLYIRWGSVLLTGVFMAFLANFLINKRIALKDLGIGEIGFLKGLFASILFCLPMFLVLGFTNDFNFRLTSELIYKNIVMAGFGEEFIYRAFLFGLLFYYSGWGFLSAAIISGIFFGAGHLYQAHDIGSAILVFLFTVGVSIGFSWFYYVWESLWMPVFLHGLMNLIWDAFQVEANVTGNIWVNFARLFTILLAVFFSIFLAKRSNRLVLKPKLWLNYN